MMESSILNLRPITISFVPSAEAASEVGHHYSDLCRPPPQSWRLEAAYQGLYDRL